MISFYPFTAVARWMPLQRLQIHTMRNSSAFRSGTWLYRSQARDTCGWVGWCSRAAAVKGFTAVLNCSVFFTVSIIHTTRFEAAIFGRLGVDLKWTLISL